MGLIAGAGGVYVMDSNQISSLKFQIAGLQADKANLQGQITTLQNDKAGLQQQVSSLQADGEALRQNISALSSRIRDLEAIHNFTIGSSLNTLDGGGSGILDKTGPAFYIPAGNIKIIVNLDSVGAIQGIFLRLYRLKDGVGVWNANTGNPGEWVNYVYNLEAGNYYLDTSSQNFRWHATVYVYG